MSLGDSSIPRGMNESAPPKPSTSPFGESKKSTWTPGLRISACSHHTFTPPLIHSAHGTFVYSFFGGKCTHFSKISLCSGQRERETAKRKRGKTGPRDGWWSQSLHQGLDVEGEGTQLTWNTFSYHFPAVSSCRVHCLLVIQFLR